MKKSFSNFSESGQILVLAVVVVGLVLVNTLMIIGGAQIFSQNTSYTIARSQALGLAEAGLDKAVASLNKTAGSYNGELDTSFGPGSFEVKITNKDAATKTIEATGYIPNKASPKAKKTVKVDVSQGIGASFNYGLQIGDGGLQMGNGAIITGSVYSNGNITVGNVSYVTGDVWIAGGVQPLADQQSDCTDGCQEYVFGKNVAGEEHLDIGQSFKPSTTAVINKVALKLKKVGSPPNLTVRIITDNSGKPSKTVLASGTLYANLVANHPSPPSFVEVALTSSPTLTADITYWIVVDTSLDNTNYWIWSLDSLQGYTRGSPSWSPNWQASSPSWSSIVGDLGFKTFMGGVVTSLQMSGGSWVNGDVHANTISGATIYQDAYFQTLIDSTVQGTAYPGSTDPPPKVFPISEANITEWQNQASEGGLTQGNVNGCNLALGPRKIEGNLTIGNNCTVTIRSPLWITGNITAGNSSKFVLDSSFGSSSGMVIVDGRVSLGNGNDLQGSGTPGSYLMLLSTYNSLLGGNEAVSVGNSTVSGIIYAPYGEVELANGASFREVSAWKIELGNNATLTYDVGLANLFFSTGPQGAYSFLKGTYQLK